MIIAFDTQWISQKGLNVTEVIIFSDIYHVLRELESGNELNPEITISCRYMSKKLDNIISRDAIRRALISIAKKGLINIRKEGQIKHYSLAKNLNDCYLKIC